MDLRFATEGTLRRMERANVLAGIGVLVSGVLLGGLSLAANAARSAAQANTVRAKEQAAKDRHDAAAAPHREPPIAPKTDDQVTAVGTRLGSAAAKYGIALSVFDAAAETTPYASRYGSAPAGAGWTMTTAQVQMSGPVTGIYRVLRALRSGAVPVEVVNLGLRPSAAPSDSDSATNEGAEHASNPAQVSGRVDATLTLLIATRPAEPLVTTPANSPSSNPPPSGAPRANR